jgi:GNAT superfamily N-acetyltransferase
MQRMGAAQPRVEQTWGIRAIFGPQAVGCMKNMTDKLTVREMTSEDPPTIAEAFRAQGWNKPQDQYEKYYREQMEGKRTVLVTELNGKFVGYLTIVWESDYPPFRDAGIPEIVDFNVLVVQQRKGIGTILMDKAEVRVLERSKVVGICVGLNADYGTAQVMYAKRGYIPDGRGIQYDGKQLKFGDKTTVDHSLVMCFTKKLKE